MNLPTDPEAFLQQLRKRVELKTGPSGSPEKTLLDAFKYFDLAGAGLASKKSFVQVMKIRIGITAMTEGDLERMYDVLGGEAPALNYRQFISRVFDSKVNLVLKDPPLPPEPTYLSRDKEDLLINEDMLRKTLDYIVYKLRGQKLNAFFALYQQLKAAEVAAGELSQSGLTVALKRLSIDVSSEEILRVFHHLSGDESTVRTDRLVDLLTKNFGADRKRAVAAAFTKFDYTSAGKVSLQLVKELFNAKQTFAVREGRLPPEETTAQFSDLLDAFSQYHGTFVVDAARFEQLFSFVSGSLKEDKEFRHFLENCFRFSDLPQPVGTVRHADRGNAAKMDDLSIRTCGLEDIFGALAEQLSGKGNKAFITFFKSLKCNDFDNDGFVFEKEFERSAAEVRLAFHPKQVAKLFEKFAHLRQRLNYQELMERLVPPFEGERRDMVRAVWESLAPQGVLEVDFETVVGSFHARNHPDFRNGHKPDYEIKTEFTDSFKTFLNIVRGTYLKVSEAHLIRFFEFFGRNWTKDYLQSVLEFAFRLKGRETVKTVGISAPYGTLPEDAVSMKKSQQRSVREDQAAATTSKLYEEFNRQKGGPETASRRRGGGTAKKKAQEYAVNAPFYTENNPNSAKASIAVEAREAPAKKGFRRLPEETARVFQESEARADLRPEALLESQVEAAEGQSRAPASQAKDTVSLRSRAPAPSLESVQEKFAKTLRFIGKIPLVLQLEYDLTEKSDERGLVDLPTFVSVLERHDLLKSFSQEESLLLFQLGAAEEGRLHIQNFANRIRGQMSQTREREMIAVFDRISGGAAEVPVFVVRNAFLSQKFRFHVYKTMTEARDMFATLLSLFEKLNLAVKDKDSFSLDDFLYLSDNFSFFVSAEDEFVRLMEASFK